ncbi:MAG: tetratricopeptide repeat protein, partial [Candidatus Hodarchaeales archaeon]
AYGKLLLTTGDWQSSIKYLNESLTRIKKEEFSWGLLWLSYRMNGDLKLAEKVYQRYISIDSTQAAYSWFKMGNLLIIESNMEEAEKAYEKALNLRNDIPKIWFNYLRLTAYTGRLLPKTLDKVATFLESSEAQIRLNCLATLDKLPYELLKPVQNKIVSQFMDKDPKVRLMALKIVQNWPETSKGGEKVRQLILKGLLDDEEEIKEKCFRITCNWSDELRWSDEVMEVVKKSILSPTTRRLVIEDMLKENPKSYINSYLMALCKIDQDDKEAAIEYILKAIALNRKVKESIQNDPFFKSIGTDPRIKES